LHVVVLASFWSVFNLHTFIDGPLNLGGNEPWNFLRRPSVPQSPLIISCFELRLEPIDQIHEGIVVILVEVIPFRFDLDVLLNQLILGQVSQNDVLRVLI
jgi:hypothetical protein